MKQAKPKLIIKQGGYVDTIFFNIWHDGFKQGAEQERQRIFDKWLEIIRKKPYRNAVKIACDFHDWLQKQIQKKPEKEMKKC
jgi:hypothetical protein